MSKLKSARKSCKSLVALALLFSICWGIPHTVLAQGSDSVRVIVYVIEASDGVPGVDQEIRPLVQQFHDTFRYSTYKLISKVPKEIRMGDEAKIMMPGLREMNITALGQEDGRIKLKVRITKKETRGETHDLFSTEFRLGKGASMVIGGYDYNNAKLIMAISSDM